MEEDQFDENDSLSTDELHPPIPKLQQQEMFSVKLQRNVLVAANIALMVAVLWSLGPSFTKSIRGGSDCLLSYGEYRGPHYYSPPSGSVGTPKCLVESKWLKLMQHSVKVPGNDKTYFDWLWIDYHDRVNVLVEDETKEGEERRFLVFQQTKYALEGMKKKAIVGGLIEEGEHPEVAARREVFEEMDGLQCEDFHHLGRFRTDVNRGMGWVNSFLATDCSRSVVVQENHALNPNEVGEPDTEKQDLKSMTVLELKKAVGKGDFLEVQWTATVSLALLHMDTLDQSR